MERKTETDHLILFGAPGGGNQKTGQSVDTEFSLGTFSCGGGLVAKEVHCQKQWGVRRLQPQGRCREARGPGAMRGTSLSCRRWVRRIKMPRHPIFIDLSVHSRLLAWGPQREQHPQPPVPFQQLLAQSAAGPLSLPSLRNCFFSPALWKPYWFLKVNSAAHGFLNPRSSLHFLWRGLCLLPSPGALGFLHFKYLTAGWTSASARRRTLCFSQWSASGARAIFSPAVREAFSDDSEKLLSSCGTSPSHRALHFNQWPLTASFVGLTQMHPSPLLAEPPPGLPLSLGRWAQHWHHCRCALHVPPAPFSQVHLGWCPQVSSQPPASLWAYCKVVEPLAYCLNPEICIHWRKTLDTLRMTNEFR